ncbi:MAG: hypothetical protein WDO24_27515 [Pseudomonadota bacterium]
MAQPDPAAMQRMNQFMGLIPDQCRQPAAMTMYPGLTTQAHARPGALSRGARARGRLR